VQPLGAATECEVDLVRKRPDHGNGLRPWIPKQRPEFHLCTNESQRLNLNPLTWTSPCEDWIAAGGTREQLDALVEEAPDWQPPPQEAPADENKAKATASEDELLEALARMAPGVEFARQRAKAAKDLGVPRGAIDAEIEARRSGEHTTAPLHGWWINERWPEPADGDALLRDIITRIRRQVVMTFESALTIALWIMVAWVHNEICVHSPILNINSAEPECGKTTTMALLSFLMPRCISTVDISEAALYRAIELWEPSFCIDEFDQVLAGAGNHEGKAALASVINSGHTRGQGVLRCEKTAEGGQQPRLFKTFAPKVLGMAGRKLPPATLTRCIFVPLQRRKGTEQFVEFDHIDDLESCPPKFPLLRQKGVNRPCKRASRCGSGTSTAK
jgi:hypothetical protein